MKNIKTNRDWRKDLSGFRGLTEKEKAGFLPVLEWFENFRLRRGLEAGSDAVDAFWRSEVVPDDRPRESRHLEQWKGAMDWYLDWLNACAKEEVDHKSLATRMQAAVRAAGARRGMALRTAYSYSGWVKRYAAFAASEREMKRKKTAHQFMESVMQDNSHAYSSRKQALNAVHFFFRHVCGMEDTTLDVNPKEMKGAES